MDETVIKLLNETNRNQIEQIKSISTAIANQTNLENRLKEVVGDMKLLEVEVLKFKEDTEKNNVLIKVFLKNQEIIEGSVKDLTKSFYQLRRRFDDKEIEGTTKDNVRFEIAQRSKKWWTSIKDNIGWLLVTVGATLTAIYNIFINSK